MNILVIIYFLCILLIIYPFAIYPLSLKIISRFRKEQPLEDIADDELPSVTLIITAYNEEKVIKRKLEEAVQYKYPAEKFDVIVVSDDSTDTTHSIVENFIDNRDENICPYVQLLIIKGRKGKTMVQNEAVKIASGEILLFSDANSIWNDDALRLMASRFSNLEVGYIWS